MNRNLRYTWSPSNTSAVCASQSLAAAGKLKLNGSLANSIHSKVSFIEHGFIRQVSVTSTEDLSDYTITVVGMQNGIIVTEDIPGPAGDPVLLIPATTYGDPNIYYDEIHSVSIDTDVGDISIGTGYIGLFPIIEVNTPDTGELYFSLNTAVKTVDEQIPTAIYGATQSIFKNGKGYWDNINTNYNVFTIKASASEDQYRVLSKDTGLFKQLIIHVLGTAATEDHELSLTFLQN